MTNPKTLSLKQQAVRNTLLDPKVSDPLLDAAVHDHVPEHGFDSSAEADALLAALPSHLASAASRELLFEMGKADAGASPAAPTSVTPARAAVAATAAVQVAATAAAPLAAPAAAVGVVPAAPALAVAAGEAALPTAPGDTRPPQEPVDGGDTDPIAEAPAPESPVSVRLIKTTANETKLEDFLTWIDRAAEQTSYTNFATFVQDVLGSPARSGSTPAARRTPDGSPLAAAAQRMQGSCLHGARAYELVRDAAEAFLLLNCSAPQSIVDAKGNPTEPAAWYLEQTGKDYFLTILNNAFGSDWETSKVPTPFTEGIVRYEFGCPCLIELIWSYWLEEGMLAQTMNAISLRFQNLRGEGRVRDPLAEFEIDPLRGINNLLWGYVQDERNRLSVRRRAHEYDHHYGLRLFGKAVADLRPADSRSKFLEAFHYLLLRCARFYREDSDRTIEADGHPVLNALKELHVILAFGAHNQFGDLPWQARVEMLTQMWLLGREEMREFLGGRIMVPYEEPWMGRVDAMKRVQGWTDTSITHFYRLARYGERILLSIRYANWNAIDEEISARTWARWLKDDIQGYLHSYRAVTGVDLTNDRADQGDDDPRFQLPGFHLRRRIAQQTRNGALQSPLN
jgi:hypothetical protein